MSKNNNKKTNKKNTVQTENNEVIAADETAATSDEILEAKETPAEDFDFSNFDAALSASLDSLYENDFSVEQPVEQPEEQPVEESVKQSDVKPEEQPETKAADTAETSTEEVKQQEVQPNEAQQESKPEAAQAEAELTEAAQSVAAIGASEEDIEEPGDVTNFDEDVFNDINAALATQIESELKRERRRHKKRKRKSFWWLLSLLPIIGIFVLFIRPLRKNMPKWFMAIRSLIFLAFAGFVMAITITKGKVAFEIIADYCEKQFGKELSLEFKPFDRKLLVSDNKSDESNDDTEEDTEKAKEDYLNLFLVIEDASSTKKNPLISVVSIERETGKTLIEFIDPSEVISTLDKKTGIQYIANGELERFIYAYEMKYKVSIDHWLYCDSKAFEIYDEKTGGLSLKPIAQNATFSNRVLYQQKLLNAIYKKLDELSHFKLMTAIKPALGYVNTDIDKNELVNIFMMFSKNKAKAPSYSDDVTELIDRR